MTFTYNVIKFSSVILCEKSLFSVEVFENVFILALNI